MKRKKRKRLVREGTPREAAVSANEEWALDFISDVLATGRSVRLLSVVDTFTRECVALEADTSFASRRVTGVLERTVRQRGWPQRIKCDNGPELTSRHFLAWCIENRIELVHIQPGKPTQNGHIESFHGKLRDEFLNVSWFQNLFDARRKTAAWREDYNQRRPRAARGSERRSSRERNMTDPCSTASVPLERLILLNLRFTLPVSALRQSAEAIQVNPADRVPR